ncbi:MAG: hypothetical protein U0Y10_08685 [Spirosomataceae bacterium]
MHWFTRKGIFFKPVSVVGWVILGLVVFYGIHAFIEIDEHSHSASDTLINWFFRMLLVGLFYSVVGYFTSKE